MWIKPNDPATQWVVYEILNIANERIFAYVCRINELLKLKELKANPDFEMEPPPMLNVKIQSYHGKQHEAINALAELFNREGMPELNKSVRYNRYGFVRCIETGTIYKNAATASKVLGISQSRLSQHLQRRPGYKSVSGLRFEFAGYNGEQVNVAEVIM